MAARAAAVRYPGVLGADPSRTAGREVGTYEKHAQLDGKWLDVVIVERLIPENQRS